MKSTEAQLEHSGNESQMEARRALEALFLDAVGDVHGGVVTGVGIPTTDLLFNLGLFARSGLLVKFLVMDQVYRRAMKVPGTMVEFGCWYGQNLVLLENLRAIHEPFNKLRKIVGFDSFSGYSEGAFATAGLYNTGAGYAEKLRALLKAQVEANVYGHQPCPHEVIVGDVAITAPAYFHSEENWHQPVALAIFDMGPKFPTGKALEAIASRLIPGSMILLDEFTEPTMPGEAQAWWKTMGGFAPRFKYRMEPIALYPSKTLVEIL